MLLNMTYNSTLISISFILAWTGIYDFASPDRAYGNFTKKHIEKKVESNLSNDNTLAPFPCEPNFYQTIDEDGKLIRYNAFSTGESIDTMAILGYEINATAFNPIDQYLYAIRTVDLNLIKIGLGGETEIVGPIGLNFSPHNGAFDANGNYYLKSINSPTIAKINLATGTTLEYESPNINFIPQDWSYNHKEEKFFGLHSDILYSYDPVAHLVEANEINGILPDEEETFGTAYYSADGFIYVANDFSGNLYRLNIENKEASFIATGNGELEISDGAACPFVMPPFPIVYSNDDELCTNLSGDIAFYPYRNDSIYSADFDFSTFEIITPPTYGTISYDEVNGEVIYHATGYGTSPDYFEYKICSDGDFQVCDIAQVYVPKMTFSYEEKICEGELVVFDGIARTESGIYFDTLFTYQGCDSLVMMNLEVAPAYEVLIEKEICPGESFTMGGVPYSTPGTYQAWFTSSKGCDSTVVLELGVLPAIENNIQAEICEGETFQVGGFEYATSGTHFTSLTAYNGCDSLVSLNLEVMSRKETNLSETICSGQQLDFNGNSISESGIYVAELFTSSGCDSTVTLSLEVADHHATVLEESVCEGEAIQVGGVAYSTSGIYTSNLTSADGCDSLVTLNLEVRPVAESFFGETICAGQTVEIGGMSFEETGSYIVGLTSANGCDSTVILDLEVAPVFESQTEASICEGESIQLGGFSFSEPGMHTLSLSSVSGCDSIVTLDLAVHALPEPTILGASFFCEGESTSLTLNGGFSTYQWSNNETSDAIEISEGGLFSVTVTNAEGCTGTAEFEAIQQTTPVLTLWDASDPTDCGVSDGSIVLSAPLQPGDYLFSIDGGATWSTSNIFENLPGGTYEILASNSSQNCVISLNGTIELETPTQPNIVNVSSENTTDCAGQNGSISLTVNGGSGSYLFSIDGGMTWSENSVFADLPGGEYEVAVSNLNGTCVNPYSETVTIEAPDELQLELLSLAPPLCVGDENGRAEVAASDGYGGHSFLWSNGQNGPGLTDVGAGEYSVTVTDEQGCDDVLQIAIPAAEPVVIALPDFLDFTLCRGQKTTFSAGPADYQYTWYDDNGPISEDAQITISEAGNYYVEVSNDNGCMEFGNVEVQVTEEAFEANFLLPSEGVIHEPIVAAEASYPIPDSIRWVYSTDSILQKQNIGNQEIMSFQHPGIYQIDLHAFHDGCEDVVSKSIVIFETADELTNPDNIEPGYTQVLEFTLFPSPNFGVFQTRVNLSNDWEDVDLYIFRGDGQQIDHRHLSGQYLYIENYDLSSFQPGVYAAVLQTATEWKYFTFVVK